MTIQETLMALLASHGEHEWAKYASESQTRSEWQHCADIAIRSAPEHNRTHVAQVVKLALDNPSNGGDGEAQDFAVLPEPNQATGELWYRGYRCPQGVGPGKPHFDTGLFWRNPEQVKRRIVGLYVARE